MLKRLMIGSSACALVLFSNPAMAAGPGSVEVGSNLGPSTHEWSAVASPLPSPSPYVLEIKVWNITHTSYVVAGCEEAAAAGVVAAGPVTNGMIGTITETTGGTVANSCDGPGLLEIVGTPSVPWDLVINDTPAATNGVDTNLSGYIDNIDSRVTSKIPGVCEFDVTGTAAMTFNEATQEVLVNETGGNLVISNVTGCLGAVGPGYTMDYIGTYPLDSPDGPINVKP